MEFTTTAPPSRKETEGRESGDDDDQVRRLHGYLLSVRELSREAMGRPVCLRLRRRGHAVSRLRPRNRGAADDRRRDDRCHRRPDHPEVIPDVKDAAGLNAGQNTKHFRGSRFEV